MYICTYHTVIENYLDKCKKKFIRLTFFGSFNNSLFMKSENECQRFNSPWTDDNIYIYIYLKCFPVTIIFII